MWDGVTILVPDEIIEGQNKGKSSITAILLVADEDPPGREFPQSRKSQHSVGHMPLRVLVAGPGCDSIGKDQFVEDELAGPGDVVISVVSKIFKALTGSRRRSRQRILAALRLALGLRVGGRFASAREKQLSGFILTSNGRRADLDRLVAEAGAATASRFIKLTEAQACARVGRIVKGAERRAACEEGIRKRWFGRYQPSPTDREVDP